MRGLIVAGVKAGVVAALVLCAFSAPAWAQVDEGPQGVPAAEVAFVPRIDFSQAIPQPSGPPPTPRHTGIKALVMGLGPEIKQLPSRENLMWAGIGGALALAAHPFDHNVTRTLVGSKGADNFFKAGQYVGALPTLMTGSVLAYAVGRLEDRPKVSHVGMDLIQSLAISEGITETLKYATRRERPDHSNSYSFPSGHSADTFAFATALERHLGWKYAGPAYILASYVAASRIPSNRHWLSDVVFGSAVGIIAGRTVTSNEAHPFPVAVAYVPGGAVVTFSHQSKAQ